MQVEAQIGSIARPLLMLNFGTRWGWVVNAMPMATLPMGKSPVTFCRGGWVVSGLDGYAEKISLSLLGFEPQTI
jgi:hypothetical protein